MVRMIHTNHFHEISLQISDPEIKSSTKTHFSEKWPCPRFREMLSLAEKTPAGCLYSKTKVLNTSRNIPDPNGTEFNIESCFFDNFVKIRDSRSNKLKNRTSFYCIQSEAGPGKAQELLGTQVSLNRPRVAKETLPRGFFVHPARTLLKLHPSTLPCRSTSTLFESLPVEYISIQMEFCFGSTFKGSCIIVVTLGSHH